jgi:hypothetical protein
LAADRICTVVHDSGMASDSMLRDVVRSLTSKGLRVGGLLQDGRSGNATDCGMLFLEDIRTGRRIQAFERRGSETRGCRLDTSSLAEAGAWLRQAVHERPDILFVNRFGRQEAEGRGLLDEIAAAVAAEIPVVIAVNRALLPRWQAFVGAETSSVAADPRQIEAWCLGQVTSGSSQDALAEPVG